MTSYLINLDEDPLRIGFNRQKYASGDQIVRDAAARLEEMIDRRQLPGGKLLKINGPASVAVSFVLAHRLSHLYGAIAVNDPKLGESGQTTYIVVVSHNPEYSVGSLIQVPQEQERILKVVICGPPNSGKSCLIEGLRTVLWSLQNPAYPYIIRACPDGQGAWYADLAQRNPDLARQLKDQYKTQFTPQFLEEATKWVRNTNTPLNLIDVGGKISAENKQIMSEATHAVILAGDEQKIPEWQDFCEQLGLKIIAIFQSRLDASTDEIHQEGDLLTGVIHRLTRGEEVSTRPGIKALAQLLVHLH